MGKEEFYYDSRDGEHRIHAVRYTPEDGQIVGVLQIIHGMAEHIARYEETAAFFVRQGYVVTGNDHLGHGLSVGEDKRFGYFCEQDPATVVVRDVHRLKKMTQAFYPDVPYIILGHSMGSFILRNYLFRYGTGIDGAVILGTGMQTKLINGVAKALVWSQNLFWGSGHVSRLIDKVSVSAYNNTITPKRTGSDWISRNEQNVDRYIADPLCGFIFTVNGFGVLAELVARMQKKENLEQIPKKLPLLLMSGAEDPVGDFGKGVRKVYEDLKAAGIEDVTLKFYENDRHEILNEDDGDAVREDILHWILEKCGKQNE